MNINDEVAVTLPGLSRPLYGRVQAGPAGGRVLVRLESARGPASIEVPLDCVAPWHSKETSK